MIRMIRDRSFWMGLIGVLVGVAMTRVPSAPLWAGVTPTDSQKASARPTTAAPGTATALTVAPRLIPFQAYLTDTAGRPVDGTHDLTFGIYDDPTQGSPRWTETHSNVPVAKGLMNVLLGSIEPFRDISTVPPGVLLFDDKRYVGVQVDGGQELVPRQQIIPAIHAADAERARQLVKPGTLDPAVVVRPDGNVGLGEASADAKLQVSHEDLVGPGGLFTIRAQNTNPGGSAAIVVEQARNGNDGKFVIRYLGEAVTGNSDSGLPLANLVQFLPTTAGPSGVEIQAGDSPLVFGTGIPVPNERMRITQEGNVGIGTTNPEADLHIRHVDGPAGIRLAGTGAARGSWDIGSGDYAGYKVLGFSSVEGGRTVMTLRDDGHVGIGTTNPDADLYIVGRGGVARLGLSGSAYGAFLIVQDGDDGYPRLRFEATAGQNQTALTIREFGNPGDPGGTHDLRVGIGSTAPSCTLEVRGDACKPGGGEWSVLSDARLKKNVQTLTGSLERLLQLRGVSFEFIDPAAINELPGPRIGMVAQEVEPIIPDWVSDGSDGYKRLTVRGFEALAVEALRDLRNEKDREIAAMRAEKDTKIEALRAKNEAQIEALRKHNQGLEARLAALETLLLKQANPQNPAVRTVAFHEAEAVQEHADVSGLQNQSTEAPRLIPFQAYLTDSASRPVEGAHTLTFGIYDDPTQGSPRWTETHGNVPVAKGLVNVLLGSIEPFRDISTVPPGVLLFDDKRYVGVQVDGGDELVPRQQIIPAIYAADADRAKEADHSAESTHAADADRARQLVKPGTLSPAVTVDANGNVGIGTTNLYDTLHIRGGGVVVEPSASLRIPADDNFHDIDTARHTRSALYAVTVRWARDGGQEREYLLLRACGPYGCTVKVVEDAFCGDLGEQWMITADFRGLPSSPWTFQVRVNIPDWAPEPRAADVGVFKIAAMNF